MSPSQRLSRGLKYSTVGPVDVTRGAVGLGVNSVRSSASWAGALYRNSQVARQLEAELATVGEAVANLPETLDKARGRRTRRRPRLLVVAVGVAVLAGGAAAFSMVRRSRTPEPSPLPPSVDVTPKP